MRKKKLMPESPKPKMLMPVDIKMIAYSVIDVLIEDDELRSTNLIQFRKDMKRLINRCDRQCDGKKLKHDKKIVEFLEDTYNGNN